MDLDKNYQHVNSINLTTKKFLTYYKDKNEDNNDEIILIRPS